MKRKIKRVAAAVFVLALAAAVLAGCGSQARGTADTGEIQDGELAITIRERDWGDVYFNEEYKAEGIRTVKGEEISVKEEEIIIFEGSGVGYRIPNDEFFPESVKSVLIVDAFSEYELVLGVWTEEACDKYFEVSNGNDPEALMNAYAAGVDSGFYLFGICAKEIRDSDYAARFAYAEKIGTFEGRDYYFAYNETAPEEGFDAVIRQDIQTVLDSMEQIRGDLLLFPVYDYSPEGQEEIAQLSEIDLSDFQTTDLNGNKVTEDIFKDYDVTMINLWQTWCAPCRREMPEIQEAYEMLPENANIISICMDAAEEEELAKMIIETSGLKCTVLVMNDELAQRINKYISAYPTTLFVDSEGRVIGTPIIGVPGSGDIAQAYLEAVEDNLK